MNETGEWIFSDEAHTWMTARRHRFASWQRSLWMGNPRSGWEFGLFGFKAADETNAGSAYYCIFTDADSDAMLL